MSAPLVTAATNARIALDGYLDVHPDEAERLAPLSRQLHEEGHAVFLRSNMRGHVTTSGFVVDPAITRALVIHHKALDKWLQPGGHFEPTPQGQLWRSALREVYEETGVSAEPWGQLDGILPLDIDIHAIPARPTRNEAAHVHHDFTYLAVADPDTPLVAQVEEVHGAQWLDLAAVAELPEERMQRLARKVARLR